MVREGLYPEMALVLVVEDEAELARLIWRELEVAGHRALLAEDGETALRLHAAEGPEAVVLDWMLPGIDGLEVLRRMRRKAPTPVLMLTARGEEADMLLGLEVGADDYLTKPFSARELVARVRAMLRREELVREAVAADREGGGPALGYGPLRLDPDAHEATLEGEPLDLTATEFGLLHLLMRKPGRTFSRSYLLESVWDVAHVGGDRSVDNAVLRLRKKLGPLGGAVETVRGVGYRLKKR
jgi:DNA-binding response OmpR family regulator